MPSAVSPVAVHGLPPARMIDPRGHRFGAGLSALLLIGSFLASAPIGVLVALISIGTSAALGLRCSIYGAIWRRLARTLNLPPATPEHEYPPRFAQTLGSIALVLALLALVVGAPAVGWILAVAVAGLQSVLALTGYCLGCRLYFLRWWVPSLATRIWTRGRVPAAASGGGSISYR